MAAPHIVCIEPRGTWLFHFNERRFGQEESMIQQAAYPVQFSVDYPDRPLDRLSTAFRLTP